jgi:glyoxylase-like metal-dependent hydrolase (beta-lactamase superfamily II)
MDYFFWLLRNTARCWSTAATAGSGRPNGICPSTVDLLARFDVFPAGVDHVVLSQMHFDHVGNVGLFPNTSAEATAQGMHGRSE